MSNIKFPPDAAGARTLTSNILTRHTTLGADSPITNIMTKHGIDLAANIAGLTTAMANDVEAAMLKRESEYNIGKRNSTLEPVMKTVGSFGQQLKIFYKPDFRSVGLFGYDITDTGRIILPTDPQKCIDLMNAIITMDATFPAGECPLFAFIKKNNLDLSKMRDQLDKALAFNTVAAQKQKQSEDKIEERNQLFDKADKDNRIIGNYLKEFYGDSPREMGLFGFNLDESVAKEREQLTKILLQGKKTIASAKIGGVVTNMSTFNLHLSKGKTVSDTPTILEPGKPFGIAKGWSTITIFNPSTTETAVVKIVVTGS